MPRSTDETRREFLLKLARTAAFVPPAMASVSVAEAAAQGQGGGPGGGGPPGQLSGGPNQQSIETFQLQEEPVSSPSGTRQAPWSRPPPGGS